MSSNPVRPRNLAVLLGMMLGFLGGLTTFCSAQVPERTVWNAVEYGAVGDGATDCTQPIQNALNDAAKAGGGTVSLPAGRFTVRGNLSIPRGVTLEGTYRAAITIDSVGQKIDGTVLLAYAGRGSNEGVAFITLAGTNAVIKGVAVIYPEWNRKDVPPVPYPPCIESHDTNNVAVIDCCLLNPYEGIKFVRAARHLVRNVTGYPIWRGLFVDECYDIGHIENIHYWPFGLVYNPADPYCEWINVNGVAFELARTDWHYMSNLFCFGYGVGYKFSDYGKGGTNGNFLGLGADSCRRAVLVEAAQLPGLLITNGEFVGRWTSTDSVCIEVTEKTAGKVSLNNCSFWGPIETCIRFNAPDAQLTANACHFCHWDNARKGAPAIRIEAGKSIISSSTFMDWGLCVSVGKKSHSTILTGNQGPNGFTWSADSEKVKVKAFANEEPANVLDPETLASYKVTFGEPRDSLFAEGVFGPEKGPEGPFRWSTGESALNLPVPEDKAVNVEFQLLIPPNALSERAGVYLAGERLASFGESGRNTLTFTIPPQKNGKARLDVIANPWNPPAGDSRILGVQFLSVKATASDTAENKYFDINQQEWMGE